MLSILITIYNYNLFPLVEELYKQCVACKVDFEILTQDDASNSKLNIENEKINSLPNCSFVVLPDNVGYRENKNILVSKSKFENLLILDGDCKIISEKFIQNYLDNINNDVVYGGRIHPKVAPSKRKLLRWKYGKFMEDKSLNQRLEFPYRSILFNNTLITKSCFNKIKFDSSFKKYGHDDTLFSFELSKIKAKIKHIENPVQHDDIDDNEVFYAKTKNSLENLHYLHSNAMINSEHSRMIVLLNRLKKYNLIKLTAGFYSLFEKIIESNLIGENPKLVIFNFFRLGYFCKIESENKSAI
ncbi:glycosyltransferase [Flavobacterium sp. SUN052]|uniref:glycosyltransferase n=1 Tax=Flavobacterium sp. SUN052 TaxID=3002441 RepID=UPI00237E5BBC|nr:glycosyltransferase [Flavobacterium sp. SUN052]MEC4005413.1 glycosyltransferase [Flavobacterium sp. SUN052]